MKPYDFTHWILSENTKGLLFFAQTLEEMLFHYGHDSLKVPALNFRFLCVEIINTIEKIEENVIDKANLKPLFEELKDSFEKDPVIKDLYGDKFENIFFIKDVTGNYKCRCSELFKDPSTESSMRQIEKAVRYILNDLARNDQYYLGLKEKIESVVKTVPFGYKEENSCYYLSRTLLTDLVNFAYSYEYIYLVVNDLFYNPKRTVSDVDEILNLFWKSFDFKEHAYCIYLPLKNSSYVKQLRNFKNIRIKENIQRYFRGSCRWIIECDIEAMDPEQARANAVHLISFFISLMQYNNHKSQSYNAKQAVVVDKEENKTFYLKEPVSLLKRGINLGEAQNNEKIAAMVDNFSFSITKLTNVIELHSSAIESNDVGNQLLNLWTIIEVLIPVEPKNSFSKINQICNELTSVLSAQYIYSLILQLSHDVVHCVPSIFDEIINNVSEGDNPIEKIAAFIVLPQYERLRTSIIGRMCRYPLFAFRISQYQLLFSRRKTIKTFLSAHNDRLRWQIMRIYRNRNMIVHDGHYFPYIDIIVQNLHYYVDSLIDFVNSYAGRGYTTISSMFAALHYEEYTRLLLLDEQDISGNPKPISDDFAVVVLGKME